MDKYPAWLSDHKSSLDAKEYEKYESQHQLMSQICREFELEISDSEEDKKKQFEKVLQLMQKIQTFGNPPKELVSNIGPGIPLDDQGNLQIPGMPGNCVVMWFEVFGAGIIVFKAVFLFLEKSFVLLK